MKEAETLLQCVREIPPQHASAETIALYDQILELLHDETMPFTITVTK